MAIGQSFQPGSNGNGGAEEQRRGGGPAPIQQAIKLISTRLPSVLGAQAIVPQELLQASGGAGLTEADITRMFAPRPQAPMPPSMPGPGAQSAPPWLAPPAPIPGPAAAGGRPAPSAPSAPPFSAPAPERDLPAQQPMAGPPAQAPAIPPSQGVSEQVPQQAPIIDTPPYVNAPPMFNDQGSVMDPQYWMAGLFGGGPQGDDGSMDARAILEQLNALLQPPRRKPPTTHISVENPPVRGGGQFA